MRPPQAKRALLLAVGCLFQLTQTSFALLDAIKSVGDSVIVVGQVAPTTKPSLNDSSSPTSPTGKGPLSKEVLEKWAEFKRSKLYLPSFDPDVLAVPEKQLEFARKNAREDIAFYKEILNEAIKIRNQFGASSRLVLKYGAKFVGNILRERRELLKIKPRVDIKPQFYTMCADIIEKALALSDQLDKEKLYKKSKVDVDELKRRTTATLDYSLRLIGESPNGGYLLWNETMLFLDDPKSPQHNIPLATEAAHLTAQFRAIGYNGFMFIIRRLVDALRFLGLGKIPVSDADF